MTPQCYVNTMKKLKNNLLSRYIIIRINTIMNNIFATKEPFTNITNANNSSNTQNELLQEILDPELLRQVPDVRDPYKGLIHYWIPCSSLTKLTNLCSRLVNYNFVMYIESKKIPSVDHSGLGYTFDNLNNQPTITMYRKESFESEKNIYIDTINSYRTLKQTINYESTLGIPIFARSRCYCKKDKKKLCGYSTNTVHFCYHFPDLLKYHLPPNIQVVTCDDINMYHALNDIIANIIKKS